ncbi:hypothetical protein D3C84_849250 [compost metagenome]
MLGPLALGIHKAPTYAGGQGACNTITSSHLWHELRECPHLHRYLYVLMAQLP